MTPEQTTTVVSSLAQSGLFAYIAFTIFRGLKLKIAALEETLATQKGTLEAMKLQVTETENITNVYRNLLSNLPNDIDQFKSIIQKTKDETIFRLTSDSQEMERRLESAEKRLKENKPDSAVLEQHLRVLRIMLGKRKFGPKMEASFVIGDISEIFFKSIEKSVPLIINANSVSDFFAKLKVETYDIEEDDVMKMLIKYQHDKNDDGRPFKIMTFVKSHITGSYAVLNNKCYLTAQARLTLEKEFSILKAIEFPIN